MARPTTYPGASKAYWFGSGSVTMGDLSKVVLHTTESASVPSYGGSGGHPTLTYDPWHHKWYQHIPLNGSATALVDPSGTAVRENRDNVVQVEIVAYSDQKLAAKYGHSVTKLDAEALKDLGEFIAWMHKYWSVPLVALKTWKPYPSSYGSNGVRLSGSQYDSFKGVLGHQHVSGNVHGDPGNLNIAAVMRYAGAVKASGGTPPPAASGGGTRPATKPKAYPKPKTQQVYLDKLKPGVKNSDSVYWVQVALNQVHFVGGVDIPLTADYDAATVAEVKKFQKQKCNDAADGKLGPKQTKYLFELAKMASSFHEHS